MLAPSSLTSVLSLADVFPNHQGYLLVHSQSPEGNRKPAITFVITEHEPKGHQSLPNTNSETPKDCPRNKQHPVRNSNWKNKHSEGACYPIWY